eukprot:TRINITY_DN16643_c0_g1_i1.p1 TRINITY_DN16643_c0_g1~~TRINITY_DN16643_c0_g1_i1.p1  ORF type:complete len:649 (-),score=136.25 TRINITY_DN16643_c0_g1_i1:28-1974(-)
MKQVIETTPAGPEVEPPADAPGVANVAFTNPVGVVHQVSPMSEPPLARLGAALGTASAAPVFGGGASENTDTSSSDDVTPRCSRIQEGVFLYIIAFRGLVVWTLHRGIGTLVASAFSFVVQLWFAVLRVIKYFLRWPPEATDATRLVVFMVFAWSAASQLIRGGFQSGALADSGFASRAEIKEEATGEMLPMELSEDVLLPLLGVSVDLFGVPWALGLSLAEPLLVLAMPSLPHAVRIASMSFDEHFISRHLGGLFGHPLLIAQVVVLRAERKGIDFGERRVAALGALVGGYAIGAAVGSILRRLAQVYFVGIPEAHVFGACLLVLVNLILVNRYGNLLSGGRNPNHGDGGRSDARSREDAYAGGLGLRNEESDDAAHMRERNTCDAIQEQASRFEARLVQITRFTEQLFMIGSLCKNLLLARFLFVLALTVFLGSASGLSVDLLQYTPLRHGFTVPWFSLVGAVVAGAIIPVLVGRRARCGRSLCLYLPGFLAIVMCFAAACASARALPNTYSTAISACFSLSILAATSNIVLTVEAVERVERLRALTADSEAMDLGSSEDVPLLRDPRRRHGGGGIYDAAHGHCHDDGIALGWGLLASGLPQSFGTRLGFLVFKRYSWLGVATVSGAACLAGFWCLSHKRKRNLFQ